jgi:20S proteasome subunit beta 2
VCDKNCAKIHYIAPNIYCCGAGTSADTENTTMMIASQLELLRLQTGAASRVVTAMTRLKRMLFKYQGHVSAALVLGGVDCTGPHLYNVYPHGSTDKLPFVSMGSGSLAAMAVLESGYKDGLSEEEAVAIVAAAIRAGIFNDLGSGSNVDLTVLRTAAEVAGGKEAVTVLRNFETPNEVEVLRRGVARPAGRVVPAGATTVLKSTFTPHKVAAAAGMTVDP